MTYTGHPIENLAAALASACYVDFDEFEYEDRDWSSKGRDARVKKKRRPTAHDVNVVAMFPQVWGSTALGFGGLGGQAITAAYTIVLRNELDGAHAVYFGGRRAYVIKKPNHTLLEDIARQRLEAVANAGVYES